MAVVVTFAAQYAGAGNTPADAPRPHMLAENELVKLSHGASNKLHTYVDDLPASLLHHDFQHRFRNIEHSVKVHRHHTAPLLR